MHLAVAELAGRCTSRQLPHNIQLSCMRCTMSTASGTLFGQTSFFTPLSDASKSFFLFPMVVQRRAVAAEGVKVGCGSGREVWAMAGTMSDAF
jgi:hypothetical protein